MGNRPGPRHLDQREEASRTILLSVMVTLPFQLLAVGFLALVWIAQWLDWESGIEDRQLIWHRRNR